MDLGSIMGAAGGILAPVAGYFSAQATNRSNEQIAYDANLFNAGQSATQRAWSAREAEKARLYNRDEAQKNRMYQTGMSNTAVQRAMKDMKKAGINPILAGKYNASTPGGAVASISIPGGSAASAAGLPRMVNPMDSAFNGMSAVAGMLSAVTNAKLTEAKTILSEAMIPGAEAIAVVTTQIGNMVKAISETIGSSSTGYQEGIREIQSTLTDLFEKLDEVGGNAKETVINIWNTASQWLGESANEVKQYFDESYQEYRRRIQ